MELEGRKQAFQLPQRVRTHIQTENPVWVVPTGSGIDVRPDEGVHGPILMSLSNRFEPVDQVRRVPYVVVPALAEGSAADRPSSGAHGGSWSLSHTLRSTFLQRD